MIQATPRWEKHQALAEPLGASLLWEAFADRAYEDDGSLRDRRLEGAMLDKTRFWNGSRPFAAKG